VVEWVLLERIGEYCKVWLFKEGKKKIYFIDGKTFDKIVKMIEEGD